MNIATAKTKYVRVTPRKARYAADIIRGKSVNEAIAQLRFSNLKGGRLLEKTLMSAVANAENNMDMNRETLYVSEIRVDGGPVLKRAWSRSKGRTARVMRRTSHFFIALDSVANRSKGK